MIWHEKNRDLNWKGRSDNTIHESLGIEITEVTENQIKGRMPIDKRTFQPMGILHGGASVVLAESLGSIASTMIVDPDTHFAVGQTLSASHVRPGKTGWANGVASLVHLGSRSHIWDIEIFNDDHKLLCTVRLTMAIVAR